MKLFSATQIKQWDEFTIAHQPTTAYDLMEHAGEACASYIENRIHKAQPPFTEVIILCGTGNNGGDGLVIARNLFKANIAVSIYLINTSTTFSHQFNVNLSQIHNDTTIAVHQINQSSDFPVLTKHHLIIDAILGIGINKPVEAFLGTFINYVNQSACEVIAIDVPSGLPADVNELADIANRNIIRANTTLTFQIPKLSFLHTESYMFTGEVEVLDIGLMPGFSVETSCANYYITQELAQPLIKKRTKFSHKGTHGHTLVIAGSYGKLGAAVLTVKGAIRAGSGLVTAYIPACGYDIMQVQIPEAMVITDTNVNYLSNYPDCKPYKAIAIGPGLGMESNTQQAVSDFIRNCKKPLVIDADALNIVSSLLAKGEPVTFHASTILTPHPKEFDRLAGVSANSFERLQRLKAFVDKHQVIVVLKGTHTVVATPQGECFFNSSGNPILAAAGSGDTLTGIITSLLTQGYEPLHAAILGVYLHGRCADTLAAEGRYTATATEVINELPKVMYQLLNNC
ncbi:MAG: NAD(P)H-hydrate dehydratase [Bacteroidia bacterium]|jgi:NAD(P)H-hydrate epimerase|nr:NAD(P)H-hydrate dehydratase [Bacteroidia bacterium]